MHILWETLSFAAKAAIVLVTFAACVGIIAGTVRGRRAPKIDGRLKIKRVNDRLEHGAEQMRHALMDPREFKAHHKRWAKEHKARRAREKRVFVVDFKGDVLASAVEHLREEITAVLAVAEKTDELVVRLESPGGAAHSYGFAAAQLDRAREKGVRVTACVDRIAASGGYMMACVADEIVAAPFSIIGSIGVVAPLPNLHRLLDRYGVDYENATAGKYKRTVSYLAKVSDEGRSKFQEQLEEMHELFKGHVQRHRPGLDVDAVATGEHWNGSRAKELGLVDRLITSDELLLERAATADVFELRYQPRRNLRERLADGAVEIAARALVSLWSRVSSEPFC